MLFFLILFGDQFIKEAVFSLKILNIGFIQFYPTYNRGVSFSLTHSNLAGTVLTASFLVLVFGYLYRTKIFVRRLGLTFMAAGGVSNLLDRLLVGGVRDIFSLGPLFFNIADVVIVLGVLLTSLTFIWHHQYGQKHLGLE